MAIHNINPSDGTRKVVGPTGPTTPDGGLATPEQISANRAAYLALDAQRRAWRPPDITDAQNVRNDSKVQSSDELNPDNNPFFNIAKLLGAKSVIEVAKNEIEVGMTMEVVQDSPMLRHVGLNLDAKAAGLRGLFETWLQYWNQAATAQKQIDKDTQSLAQR